MYEKFLNELVKRLIGNHFNETAFKCEIEFNHDTEMISYEVETVNKKSIFHKYNGYLGSVGHLVVTTIDDNFLDLDNFIEIT